MLFHNSFFGVIKFILLFNCFLIFLEIVITEMLLTFLLKKLEIIKKFFSTPPPSIDGVKIISLFFSTVNSIK